MVNFEPREKQGSAERSEAGSYFEPREKQGSAERSEAGSYFEPRKKEGSAEQSEAGSYINQVKRLREETEAPVNECFKALSEAKGDMEKAKEILRKWGQNLAAKKVEREVKEGIVDVYLHPNKKVGVILELRCESDFVAQNEAFQKLAHELCLQIAAANPRFVSEENIPRETLEKEKEIYSEQFSASGKSPAVINGIIEGKLKKYKEENCLLSQPWIKDETKKIKDLLTEHIAKLGENIIVRGFSRFSIG